MHRTIKRGGSILIPPCRSDSPLILQSPVSAVCDVWTFPVNTSSRPIFCDSHFGNGKLASSIIPLRESSPATACLTANTTAMAITQSSWVPTAAPEFPRRKMPVQLRALHPRPAFDYLGAGIIAFRSLASRIDADDVFMRFLWREPHHQSPIVVHLHRLAAAVHRSLDRFQIENAIA